MDVDARLQLFDLKKKYSFQTTPGVDQYNMPLYDLQTELGGQAIGMYPVYQGFTSTAYINGISVPLQTQKASFFNLFPNVVQNQTAIAVGDGINATYQIQLPTISNVVPFNPPINALLRGHVDISGIISTGVNTDPPSTNVLLPIATTSVNPGIWITTSDGKGSNIVVCDSGQFLVGNQNYGLLMSPGNAPLGNGSLGTYDTVTNTVNYLTGLINVTFPTVINAGVNINVQYYYFQSGLPRSILFYNNTLTLRSVPAQQYLVELDAYLSPAAFLNTTAALQFGYMAEYIARGAASLCSMSHYFKSKNYWFGNVVKDNGQLLELRPCIAKDLVKVSEMQQVP